VEKYLQVHLDILGGGTPFPVPASRRRPGLALGRKVLLGRELTVSSDGGRAALGDGCSVGDFARFAGRVCVGPGSRIGKGASLEDCVVLAGANIGDGVQLKRCVVGPGCRIGANSTVTEGAALAGGSEVRPFSIL
jgi:NDP-sugar pyrophosphorylase family protein